MFGLKNLTNSTPAGDSWRNEQLRFKVIVDNIADGVLLIDNEQVIQIINPAAAKMCGWTVEEASGLNVNTVVQLVSEKGDPIKANNPFDQVFKNNQTIQDNNAFIVSRSHQQVSITLTLSPLLDNNQQSTAAVVVMHDVTQARAQEQQRADFISTASHEMRTPVAAIEGYLSLALNDKVATIDNRARGYLDKAHDSTQHLGQLFQDLLTSAKAEDGRLVSHPQVVELGEMMHSLAEDLKFAADKKGLILNFDGSGGATIDAQSHTAAGTRTIQPIFYVYADPDRLREVLTNLVDNAIKYTPQGNITLSLTGNDKIVQLGVHDTGPGIPPEDVPHLFQKFYRVDNSATRTIGGTGLGLFICRKIVELYSGRIWVESAVGQGSNFYINLPRISREQAAQLQAQAPPTPQKA
ncbi:MAG TPA: ATP-binding protein [Candidatus Saccharimonadales bacterium]|nr:ATP-binding protein [Candidatus Saccharimonadales bacterium]